MINVRKSGLSWHPSWTLVAWNSNEPNPSKAFWRSDNAGFYINAFIKLSLPSLWDLTRIRLILRECYAQRSTARLASKLWTNFPLNLFGWELRKCKMWERAYIFFYWDSKFQHVKICTYWLSGRAGRKIFGLRSWRKDRAQRRPRAVAECQISSPLAQINSVNKHFIIWTQRVEDFEFF